MGASGVRARIRLVMAAALAALAAAPASGAPAVTVSPARLELSTFSRAREVEVVARISGGAEPVIVIRGPAAEEVFNRKAHVGPFWINSGRAHISGAPSLLLTFTRRPLDTIVRRAEVDALLLDTAAVRRAMTVAPPEADLASVRDSYVAAKVRAGAYVATHGDAARVQHDAAGNTCSVRVAWPRTARPAEYTVTVYEARNGRIIGSSSASLAVAQAGVSAWLAAAAREHAMAYGALAVLVALSLGFGIDFLATCARRVHGRGWQRGRGPTDAGLPASGKMATTDHVRR